MELLRGHDFRKYVDGSEARASALEPGGAQSAAHERQERETARPRRPDGAKQAMPAPARSPANLDRLLAALRQLVEGIHTLHSAGKLHRDIKPSNVLVTREGRVVLLDFGVATEILTHGEKAHTGSGEVVGTACYMAPEQADDSPPSPASDWYSVGVMLYEALVGRPPFVGSLTEILTMKTLIEPPAPSACVEGVPAELDALCRSLLDRDPARRPTGVEILRRLGVTRSSAPPATPLGGTDSASAFIGREGQLGALRDAFDAARSGRGITVRVGGASGMGKSTVVNCFLDELTRSGGALVLRGRAYEREAVPYKAVDSVIDALSRHLMGLAQDDEPLALPDDVWALARCSRRWPGASRWSSSWTTPSGATSTARRSCSSCFARRTRRRCSCS
jgi:hypothetical protein